VSLVLFVPLWLGFSPLRHEDTKRDTKILFIIYFFFVNFVFFVPLWLNCYNFPQIGQT